MNTVRRILLTAARSDDPCTSTLDIAIMPDASAMTAPTTAMSNTVSSANPLRREALAGACNVALSCGAASVGRVMRI